MKQITLIHGGNTFKSKETLNFLIQKLQSENKDTDIETIDAEKADIKNLTTDLLTIPFLTENRLVIIKNVFKAKLEIADKLEKIPKTTNIVFFENKNADKRLKLYKTIKKIGEIHESIELKPFETKQWIKQLSKDESLEIADPLIQFLIDYAGNNQWKLFHEMKKLKSYVAEKKVKKEDIEKIVKESISSNIFNFTDALSAKNKKLSIKLLKKLINSGEEINMIFFMLIRQFRLLIEIKDLKTQKTTENEIAKILKTHPFVIKKTSPQCNNFNFEELKTIYANLLEIDFKLKSGKIKISSTNKTQLILELEKLLIKL